MHLCNLLFKVEDGRKPPKCELRCGKRRICEVDCKSERKMYKLSCESELKGVYECVVSTVEEPTVSTAVKVTINGKLIGLQVYMSSMYAIANCHYHKSSKTGTIKFWDQCFICGVLSSG
jgi:hypothetical protein